MRKHRRRYRYKLWLIIGLVALVAPAAIKQPSARATGAYSNAAIADKALSYVGQWGGNACKDAAKPGDSGGQCRAFVNCIVWMVSNHTQNLGGDYFQAFLSAGGTEITDINQLRKGDIVQVGEGTHTFIIVSHVSGNTFNVVDSNENFDEKVSNYNRAFSLDSTTRAFRMGGVNDGTLYYVKTHATGSGRVEVHSATAASDFQAGQHTATWLSTAGQSDGWFQMVGSDLYFIKIWNAPTGRIEVHSATAASGYQSGVHYATVFNAGEADKGWFQMDDVNHDGVPDLVFIKTRNTGSGHVEFFVADGALGYSRITSANVTPFSPLDASNGWFQAQGPDLVFIKTRNTWTGTVEYFRVSAASGYHTFTVATPTAFSPVDQNNGWFSSEDIDGDGLPDLVFIKTHHTGSGQVELYVASGSSGYLKITAANATWLNQAEGDRGWFQMNSKA